jgi:hypothetical protein
MVKVKALAKQAGVEYGTMQVYGSVARAFEFLNRFKNVSFKHHMIAMAAEGLEARLEWLRRAETEGWSAMTLRREINKQRIGRAPALSGKHRVIYAGRDHGEPSVCWRAIQRGGGRASRA